MRAAELTPPSPSLSFRYNFSKFALALQTGDGEGYDEACHPTVHTLGRQEDYLLIPQSILSRNTAYQPTYYCGSNDNLVVFGKSLSPFFYSPTPLPSCYFPLTASPPYMMHFASDEMTLDAAQETGFSLTYRLRTTIL